MNITTPPSLPFGKGEESKRSPTFPKRGLGGVRKKLICTTTIR